MHLSPVNFTIWLLGVSMGISMGADRCIFTTPLSWSGPGREPGYRQASVDRGSDHVPLQAELPHLLEVILSQEHRQSEDNPYGQTLNHFASAPDSFLTPAPIHPLKHSPPSLSSSWQNMLLAIWQPQGWACLLFFSYLNHCLAFPSWYFHHLLLISPCTIITQ